MNNAIRYCLVMVATVCSAISSTSLPDLSRYKLTPLFSDSFIDNNPLFLILVPELSTEQELKKFAYNIKVPQDFFRHNQPEKETNPVILLFNYQETGNKNKREEAGALLASGINAIHNKFNNSKIILIGHGHGANVINKATQSNLKKTIDCVIQLCPPISDGYIPNPATILRLINFYTDHDFLYQNSQQFKKYYADQNYTIIHNTKLFFNGYQKAPNDFMHPMLGNRLLELSKKIIETYPHHPYLVAFIDTIKECADMRIMIDPAPAQSTDYSLESKKEQVTSNREKSQLKACTGKSVSLKLSTGSKTRTKNKALEKQALKQKQL